MTRSGERGIALLVAIFMVLITSAVGTSMMAVAQTETLSTINYRTTAQSRYAAESGMARAANHLLFTYVPPATGAADDLASYNVAVSPVTFNGNPVVLSSDPDVASNYPVAGVVAAFDLASKGQLAVGNGTSAYVASATLLSMREFTNALSGTPQTLQAWRITGVGTRQGVGAAEVEISTTIEQPLLPMYSYAAFGTGNGCDVLDFSGGGATASYDSNGATPGTPPAIDNWGGNVGTNGNLGLSGNPTIVNGTLSTPRAGVGNCTQNNVTAVTIQGKATVTGGLVQLPQEVEYDDPEPIVPTPPTVSHSFTSGSGCPAGVLHCAASAGGATFTPPTPTTVVSMGNVTANGGATIHLNAGIYEINSISLNGNSNLVIDSGPVIFRVEGAGVGTPISLNGGNVSNTTYVSSNLQFIYGGTGVVRTNGGAATSMLIYAPNAEVDLSGNANFYGAIVGGTVEVSGGAKIVYDRALENTVFRAGNVSLTSFNWESF
jgi:hypothetical protein